MSGLGVSGVSGMVLRSMAAAVHARGGRFSWEGVGMHGSPSLTRRIAHIRRPPPGRAASPFSRAALGAGCCLIAVAVAACRPDGDGTGNPLLDIQRQIDTATVASWPVERLIDDFPDTEVAVAQGDRPRAEEILLDRRTEDPTGPWSARLGRFYAASATGYRVRITDDGPRARGARCNLPVRLALGARRPARARCSPSRRASLTCRMPACSSTRRT